MRPCISIKGCLLVDWSKTHSFKISNHKKAKSTPQKMADFHPNKAVYTASKVACEWEGVVIKKANQAFG